MKEIKALQAKNEQKEKEVAKKSPERPIWMTIGRRAPPYWSHGPSHRYHNNLSHYPLRKMRVSPWVRFWNSKTLSHRRNKPQSHSQPTPKKGENFFRSFFGTTKLPASARDSAARKDGDQVRGENEAEDRTVADTTKTLVVSLNRPAAILLPPALSSLDPPPQQQ